MYCNLKVLCIGTDIKQTYNLIWFKVNINSDQFFWSSWVIWHHSADIGRIWSFHNTDVRIYNYCYTWLTLDIIKLLLGPVYKCYSLWLTLCYNLPLSKAVTVLLLFPVLIPQTTVSIDKEQNAVFMLAVNTPLTTQVRDVLSVVLGHTPQLVALTLYLVLLGQIPGSHWKVSAFLLTWARWTLSGGGAVCIRITP